MLAQPTTRRRPHRLLPIVLFALVCLVYLGHAALYGTWIDDDAGISFTYARNLARGEGLVLNPGGERVEGYSNPLWVFVLALTFRAGLFDPVATPKILSIAAAMASFVLLARISRRLFGREDSVLHLLPALALACSVPFVSWSISGLENGLYVLLILLAADLRLAELDDAARVPYSGLVLLLVAITRPEGALYFGAAGAHALGVAVARRRVTRQDMAWVAAFTLPFLAYHAWHYLYFADLLPNTYYAKMQAGGPAQHVHEELLDTGSEGWEYLRSGLRDSNLTWLLPVSAIFLLVWSAVRRSSGTMLVLVFLLAGAFFAVFVGGDWMLQYRFLTPMLALAYLVVAGMLIVMVRALANAHVRGPARAVRAIIAAILVVGVAWMTFVPALSILKGPVKPPSISFAVVAARGVRFATLAKELFIEDASLLDPDLGGTSYASGLRLIDLGGLADVHIARHEFDQRYLGRYIFVEQRPTFIRTHCVWSRRSQIHRSLDLRRDYLPLWESPCTSPCCPGTLDGEYIRKDAFVDPAPAIEQPLEITFAGGPTLVGYRIEPRVVPPGGGIRLTTWWTMGAEATDEVRLGVTPIGPGGARLDGHTRPFTHGIYLPSRWLEDEVIREEHELTIPGTLAEGPVQIELSVTGPAASEPRVIAAFDVGRPAGEPDAATGRSAALSDESSIRRAESLALAGDLSAATEVLSSERNRAPRDARLAAALSRLSTLWYRHASELLKDPAPVPRWSEAMRGFQAALACRPANAFARKRIEELRPGDYVDRVYGRRLREAQEDGDLEEPVSALLLAIEDDGFTAEAEEIVRRSPAIQRRLAAEGTLASLSLLHTHYAVAGDTVNLDGVQARLDAAAPAHVVLGDHLVYLGSELRQSGPGSFRLTWWFQVTRPMAIDYKIFLHAYPEDPANLPADRPGRKFLNLDHFPDAGTSTWEPGAVVRHSVPGRLAPGAYKLLFGFFEPQGTGKLPAGTTDSPVVEMGRFVVR